MESDVKEVVEKQRRSRNGPLRGLADHIADRVVARITPVFRDSVSPADGEVDHLIRCVDDLERIRDHVECTRGYSKRQLRRWRPLLRQLSLVIDGNLTRLESLGITRVELGEVVDMERHDIAYDMITRNRALDRRIVDVIAHGYANSDRVVRRPLVVVARYQPETSQSIKKGT